MTIVKSFATPVLVSAVALSLASTGCATKKYVSKIISPIEQKIAGLDKKTTEHGSAIEDLEKGVSRADEHAVTADSKAQAAAGDAAKAQQSADQAGKDAKDARSVADKGLTKAGEVETSLSAKVENMDNYKLVDTANVLFRVGSDQLTADGKEQLDAAAQKFASAKHAIVEVQGFADKSGSPELNLDLSRRRASSVVRYLTLRHKLPLYRIHVMGYGAENPVADNATREGRKQNRRVEVKLYSPDLTTQMSSVR